MTTTPNVTDPTKVLFIDRDGGAPQIAASLLHRLAGERVGITTATTEPPDPTSRSDEMLVAMGLDPADAPRLSAGAIYRADRVVILGADLDVARLPGPRYEEWDVEHDNLDDRIHVLSDEISAPPSRGLPSRGGLPVLARLRNRLGASRRR